MSTVDGSLVDTTKARELHDQLLVAMPEGARHDADICSFCVEAAASSQETPVPPGPESTSTAPTEGGTTTAMSEETKTMTVETHEALQEKALREATSATEAALATKIQENENLTAEVASLKDAKTVLEGDNARLNGELDQAQISLKVAVDEAASLKQEKAEIEAAALRTEVASKRAEQVRALGLFEETFITEKASHWAELDQAAWDERVEEWGASRQTSTASLTETASALTGTTGALTTETAAASDDHKSPSRRAALGL